MIPNNLKFEPACSPNPTAHALTSYAFDKSGVVSKES